MRKQPGKAPSTTRRRYVRPELDEYFLKIASVVGERSTCLRHHVGAVAVGNKHILSTGYNGAAAGLKDCLELGCLRDENNIPSGTRHEICRAIHAEQNVIIQAALHGVSLEGATIYCTHTPCILCAKMLVNARVKRFVSFGKYADDAFKDLFREAGVEFETRPRPSARIKWLE
jgi:dCMP deaminase